MADVRVMQSSSAFLSFSSALAMKHRHSPYTHPVFSANFLGTDGLWGNIRRRGCIGANRKNRNPRKPVSPETVEVVSFHGTFRCISCIAVGNLAKETLRERFHK
jgi:hypothetical protein